MELQVEVFQRLGRFGRYLHEQDVKEIIECGHPNFSKLRKAIEEVHRYENWPKQASRLTYESAEKFSYKLGQDLMVFAMNKIKQKSINPVSQDCTSYDYGKLNWQDVIQIAAICSLGRDIMFYNGD